MSSQSQPYLRRIRAVQYIIGLTLLLYVALYRTPIWLPITLLGFVLLMGALVWHSAGPLPKFSTLARRAVVVTLLSVPVLLMVEVAGRFIVSKYDYWGIPIFKAHPSLIKTLLPGTEGDRHFVQNDGSVGVYPVRISKQGIRDREYGPKSADEFRVLLVGDSFTFGKSLTIEETLSRQLEPMLDGAQPNKSITVVNGGIGGFGPWQAHGFLVETGLAFEPDLVILQVLPSNDLPDTMIRKLAVPRACNPISSNFKMLFLFAQDDWKARTELGLIEHSAVYRFLYARSSAQFSVRRLLNGFRPLHNPAFPEFPPPEPRTWFIEHSLREWYLELEEGWHDLERDIVAMRDDCSERGIDFLAFVVPGVTTILDQSWNFAVGDRAEDYERGKTIRLLHAMFQREEIPHVRLADVIKRHPNPQKLYFLRDGHFMPLGAHVSSETIATHLKKHYFPRPEP